MREEILDELPPETVAEGVRDLDSDDAVYILEDLPQDEQAEILEQLPPPERVALDAQPATIPEDSAGRRMQTDFIAVPPDWTVGQAIDYMRETERPARPLLRALRGRRRLPPARRGERSTGCCAPSVRRRFPN